MFLTTPSNRHHIKSAIAGQGCDVWTHVSLTIDFPWYCLSYSSCQAATLGFSGTEFLSNPDQIAELLSDRSYGGWCERLLLRPVNIIITACAQIGSTRDQACLRSVGGSANGN